MTSIGSSVFTNCMGLESAVIGKGLTEISAGMLMSCRHISNRKIVFPKSKKGIDNSRESCYHITCSEMGV